MLPWTRKIKFSKITLVVFSILVVFLFLGFSSQNVLAQNATDTLGVNVIDQSSIALSGTDIRLVVINIINTVLGLLGLIAVSLIIYAGFTIMTSGGDESKVSSGKKIIINAVIGLAVILSAFAIVKFVANKLLNATGINTGSENTGQAPELQTFSGSGSLGTIVKDHYPFRDQKDVARNTAVVVTFFVPINPASIATNSNNSCWTEDMSGSTTTGCDFTATGTSTPYYGDCYLDVDNKMSCDSLNTSTIKIDTQDNIGTQDSGLVANVLITYDNNHDAYTIVLRPLEYLGSSTTSVDYSVYLLEGIQKAESNQSIFVGRSDKAYRWNFQTGTNLDLSPPYITSVSPSSGKTITKDSVIKINFSEPIDPSTVQGFLNSGVGGFDNILINNSSSTPATTVTGTWKISNGYKTVEFIPEEACGQNSCGQTKYCLPVTCTLADPYCTKTFSALVRTAEPTRNPDAPFEAVPFTGVYDLAFNGLDNRSNNPVSGAYSLNKPQIPAGDHKIISLGEKTPDNEFWSFNIKNEMDNKNPYIVSILPTKDSANVVGDADVKIKFSKELLYSSIGNVQLVEYPAHVCADNAINTTTPCVLTGPLDDIWFRTLADTENNQTELSINHRVFGPNGLDLFYFPMIPHTLQDSNQNCFYPGFGPASTGVCNIDYNEDGTIRESINCTPVTNTDASRDTSCVYSTVSTTANLASCQGLLEGASPSPYTPK